MESVTSICPVCGKTFSPKRGLKFGSKFCSMKCYQRSWYRERMKDKRKVCPVCGKEFHPDVDNRTYCSPECRIEGKRRFKKAYDRIHCRTGVVYERVCPVCGKKFTTIKPKHRYCCHECSKKDENARRRAEHAAAHVIETKTCAWCGRTFETWMKNKLTCCKECGYEFCKHRCSKDELEAKRKAKREEAVRLAAEKALKVRINGMTEEQMQDVINAQDGDPALLWKRSQGWTPAQRKYAKARYEGIHGLFTHNFNA